MDNMKNLLRELYSRIECSDFLECVKCMNPVYAYRKLNTDDLTGYPNGRALRRHIRKVSRAGQSVTIYAIDVIGLTKLNKKYGHDVGDELIKTGLEISDRVVSHFGGRVYRNYGDDSVAILTNIDEETAKIIPGRIENSCRIHVNTNSKLPPDFPINIVVGYIFSPDGKGIVNGKDLIGLDDAIKEMSRKKEEFYKKHPELNGRNRHNNSN